MKRPGPPDAHHRFVLTDGREIFYREAGDPAASTILLLHGAPASSFMFRSLMPLLADSYHAIAPDYAGLGSSESPPAEEFDDTFDALTGFVGSLLERLDITRSAIYVQDYGAPVGWRLALHDPTAITAVITRNGNAYTRAAGSTGRGDTCCVSLPSAGPTLSWSRSEPAGVLPPRGTAPPAEVPPLGDLRHCREYPPGFRFGVWTRRRREP